MANQEICAWIGKSGTKYTHYIYPRHPNINEGQDGNYIYAKKIEMGYGSPCTLAKVISRKGRQRITIAFAASTRRGPLMSTFTSMPRRKIDWRRSRTCWQIILMLLPLMGAMLILLAKTNCACAKSPV